MSRADSPPASPPSAPSPPGATPRRRRIVTISLGILALLLGAAVFFAPARQNYYAVRAGVRIQTDLPYVSGSAHPKQQLDLYLPAHPTGAFPMVVYVHGGVVARQDRRFLQPLLGLYGAVGVALANQGVGAAVISYRQHPQVDSFAASLDDVAQATRFVLEHAATWGADPKGVVVVGHSMGGFLVSLLALDPTHLARNGVGPAQVRGFVSLAGCYDLRDLIVKTEQKLPAEIAAARKMAGTDAGLDAYSPLRHVHQDHPPLLLLVGLDDDETLISEQRELVRALAAVSPPVTALELAGHDHMSLVLKLSTASDGVTEPLVRFIRQVTSPPN